MANKYKIYYRTVYSEPSVLLVDDDEYVLKSLVRGLRAEPYKLFTADNGPDALKIFKEHSIPLIISDQRMDPMSGIEFLEKTREISPNAIRILLTGYKDISVAEEAINRAEIYRFLTKPCNESDLRSTILQGLKKWRLEKDNLMLLKKLETKNIKLEQLNKKLVQIVK